MSQLDYFVQIAQAKTATELHGLRREAEVAGDLTKIERGDRRYDQPFLEAAAEALRCGPADLWCFVQHGGRRGRGFLARVDPGNGQRRRQDLPRCGRPRRP